MSLPVPQDFVRRCVPGRHGSLVSGQVTRSFEYVEPAPSGEGGGLADP